MKIHSDANVELLLSNYIHQKQKYLSTTAIVFFNLTNGQIIDRTDAYSKICEQYENFVVDVGMPKIHGEVIVSGTVLPENNIEAKDIEWRQYASVTVEIGEISKRALVLFRNKDKEIKLQDKKFAKNIFEYHGEQTFSNLANIEFTERGMDDPRRMKFAGTYGAEWLKEGLGTLPNDYNFAYNNVAAECWQIGGAWEARTHYAINGVGKYENVAERHFEGYLPKVAIGVIAHRFKASENNELIPVNLNLDTIRFLPDVGIGIMIWHGVIKFDKDFDTIAAVLYENFVAKEEVPQVHELSIIECVQKYAPLILKLMIDLHKQDKHDPSSPQYDIEESVVEVKKENRQIKHKRLCNIYNDYYSYYILTDALPLLMPYTKDRFSILDGDGDLYKQLDEIYNPQNGLINKINISYSKEQDTIYQAYKGEILESEKNFNSALSALLSKVDFLKEQEAKDFDKLVSDADLLPYSIKRFLLGYNPTEYSDSYRNWGVDKDGEFVIPKGVIIPTFDENKIFVNAVIRPNGFLSSKDEFYLPGGYDVNGIGWFNHIVDDNIKLKVLVFDVGLGLRLNEETDHYLDIIALRDISDLKKKKLDVIEKALIPGNEIFVLAPESELENVTKEVKEVYPFIQVVSLGKNTEDESYKDLKEFIYDDKLALDEFFAPLSYLPIIEPTYLPGEYFEAAFDKKMEEKFGLTPGKQDFDEAALRMLDKKKEETLQEIPYEHLREKVAQSFDEAKERLKEEQKMDFATVQKIGLEKQKENLNELYETQKNLTPEDKVKFFGTEDTETWFKEQEALLESTTLETIKEYNELENNFALVKKQWEEQAQVRNASVEEQVASRNLTRGDFISLKEHNILEVKDVKVEGRDFDKLDFTKFKFTESSFYRVSFEQAIFNGAILKNCSFTECDFVSTVLNYVKFEDIVFLKCKFSSDIWSNAEFKNCEFLDCTVDGLTIANSNLKDFTVSSGEFNDFALLDSNTENLEISFCKVDGFNVQKGTLDRFSAQDATIDNILFEDISATHFSCSYSQINGFEIQKGTFERFEISNSEVDKAKFTGAHFTNVNLSQSKFANSNLGHNVYSELFAQEADFSGCNFDYIVAKECNLSSCNLRETSFIHANLLMSNLAKNLMGKACFKEANLFGCDFTECKLLDNDFTSANLKRTILAGYQRRV